MVLFDSLKCFDRGPDVFLAKIGNLDQSHGDFLSFSDFLKESGSSFRPRRTHAYLMFASFPDTFPEFRKFVMTKLELPRRANISISVYCDFFQAIHGLDDDRYISVLTQWTSKGRPLFVFKRKFYDLCDWQSLVRFEFVDHCHFQNCRSESTCKKNRNRERRLEKKRWKEMESEKSSQIKAGE